MAVDVCGSFGEFVFSLRLSELCHCVVRVAGGTIFHRNISTDLQEYRKT